MGQCFVKSPNFVKTLDTVATLPLCASYFGAEPVTSALSQSLVRRRPFAVAS